MTFYIKQFEKTITWILIFLLGAVVLMSVADLAFRLFQEVTEPPYLLLNAEVLTEFFGMALFVLIGIELIETLKAYISENQIRGKSFFS